MSAYCLKLVTLCSLLFFINCQPGIFSSLLLDNDSPSLYSYLAKDQQSSSQDQQTPQDQSQDQSQGENQNIKQECIKCLEEGRKFTPLGCVENCQEASGVVVVPKQIQSTVIIKRNGPICLTQQSHCREFEEMTTCKECIAFNGSWVQSLGCQQSCPPDVPWTCYKLECPSFQDLESSMCLNEGGILCDYQGRQSCVSGCSECLQCQSCNSFKGGC
eukprot:TRINITY_DN17121_c0_g1_i1.p1 TRINITY_DN17121_c0_g1~~TRINITY_DN17121_c0_g1_i1.p1  ORF type:complete len:243 (+),score=24.98 TRINITY_DN17121_c0_g1_i1:84-731(+)